MLQQSYSDIGRQKDPTKNIHQSDPTKQPLLQPFLKLYYFIVGVGAIPVRLLIHKNFGERSISPLALLISLGFHVYYLTLDLNSYTLLGAYILYDLFGITILDISGDSPMEKASLWLLLLFNGYFIYLYEVFIVNGKKVYHNIANSFKNDKVEKSTYFRGESEYFDKENFVSKQKWTIFGKQIITEINFRILIEPQKIFLYGLAIFLLFTAFSGLLLIFSDVFIFKWFAYFCLTCIPVGILISLSAICLFLEEYGIYSRIRHSALDILDSEKDYQIIMHQKEELQKGRISNDNAIDSEAIFPEVKIC